MRRACVVGAQGALGGAAVAELRSAGWEVFPAGRREGRDEDFRCLDLDRPETIAPALSDVDVVISTVAHPELAAERWALEHGRVLVNCSHAAAGAAAALEAEARQIEGTVLLNGGLVPGIANLAAAELLTRHPQADCLEVAFTVLAAGTAGRAGAEFAHRALTSAARHRVVTLPMGEPFGELACFEVAESEGSPFDQVAGSRRVRTYLGFGDRLPSLGLRALNALRLMRTVPKAAFAPKGRSGGEISGEPTAVWIGARLGERLLGASRLECSGDYRTTAAAARWFGERLTAANQPGCFNPEDIFDASEFRQLLLDLDIQEVRL